ncbi:membrane protein [Clostridium sulfidigenes]|uniref:Membrane protein n=1 Tax=Clostridium sulfidigenes TaxID=318464 RepID=A0A084JB95_9CLOT|nr:DUF445 family protein [Clostridium sulfidigenes]KEZ86229.1 membrane protein [Clostridium sulfidigenes]
MNSLVIVFLLAVVGGVIGWVTNILAIKLMFRPINPIKIPLINLEIIGLIPKRKNEIAHNIGEVVAKELLSIDDVIKNAITEEDKVIFSQLVKNKIRNLVAGKMDFVPAPFRIMVQGPIDNIIEEEVDGALKEMESEAVNHIKDKVDIKEMVEEKINELDLQELERIIINVAKKELKHIEVLGFILGAAIGIVQGLVVMLFK